jgi:hypothetical protein
MGLLISTFFVEVVGVYHALYDRMTHHITGFEVGKANFFHMLQYLAGMYKARADSAWEVDL